eukprot:TRINITY_DN2535_c0_g1_i2.p1 TRINITY_DN2535_c0_g1~~TRINITY_DN2535_c0_g1_i2.p1  ORF type:complete len:455 (+),score=97.86 TRINITY_DN2535_c0_g1_i2:57-1421(+)
MVRSWRNVLDPSVVDLKKQELVRDRDHVFQPLYNWNRSGSFMNSVQGRIHFNTYLRMFYDVIFPKLRESLMMSWNPQIESEVAIKMLSNWCQIMPPEVVELLLDQVVMAKLRQEVSQWDPLKASVRISDWLHPWMQILRESRMSTLWKPVLSKLSSALKLWNANDKTAHVMLRPWKEVLQPALLEEFLRGAILPKLHEELQNWQISAGLQDNTPWASVLLWHDMFQKDTFVVFLLNNFFPKWLDTLYEWLTNKPNIAEVHSWYVEWKKSFPVALVEDPNVVQQFNTALEMMQGATTVGRVKRPPPHKIITLPKIQSKTSSTSDMCSSDMCSSDSRLELGTLHKQKVQEGDHPLSSHKRRKFEFSSLSTPPKQQENRDSVASVIPSDPTTVKQLVELLAKEHGILFMPTKRSYDGKLVYTFGKLSLVINKNVLLVSRCGTWVPVSLEDLIILGKC